MTRARRTVCPRRWVGRSRAPPAGAPSRVVPRRSLPRRPPCGTCPYFPDRYWIQWPMADVVAKGGI
eukprot:448155-Prymnesium_polylepis.1